MALLIPAVLAGLFALISLAIGAVPLGPAEIVPALVGRGDPVVATILLEIRLPRTLLALGIGFTLGVSGAALQGLLRNPLADPGVIGVSAAAAFGAVTVFYTGLAGLMPLALPLGGIAGALGATVLVHGLAGRGTGTMGLVLAGVALSSLCGALTALVLNLSPNPYAAMEIVTWLMGSLADRSLDHVLLALPLMAIGWGLMLSAAPALDALTLGEDTAESLGFPLARIRLKLIAGAALAVGSSVAVAGAIGFVGLVVPHLIRPLVGHRPGRLMLASGFGGAILTLLADIAVRVIHVQPELKLGVVTALLGAPFLFALIWRFRRD